MSENKDIIGDCTLTLSVKNNKIQVSDGYHTFDELYDHRQVLFIKLCEYVYSCTDHIVWKSKKHNDGSMFDGMFIVGIGTMPGEILTYHLDIAWRDVCNVIPEIDKAPERDGHTSDDVLKRLLEL